MITAILSDFSRVLLFPKDTSYTGSLNELHRNLLEKEGYNILDYFALNTELLTFYKNIQDKVDLYIFTSETIQDDPNVQPFITPLFKEVYSAQKLGLDKKDPTSYESIANDIGKSVDEIIFLDDSSTNVEAAKEAGMHALLYQTNSQAIEDVTKLL